MIKHPCVQKRGNRYHFRKKVPAGLVKAVGKREIKKSLGTSDLREANRLAAIEAVKADAVLSEARLGKSDAKLPKIRKSDLIYVATVWFHSYENDAEARFVRTDVPPNEMASYLELISQDISAHSDLHDPSVLAGVQGIVENLIEDNNLGLNAKDDEYWLFCQYVNRGIVESDKRKLDKLKGDFNDTAYDTMFGGVTSNVTPGKPVAQQPSLTLSQLINEYESEPARQGITPKKILSYRIIFAVLEELIGRGADVRSITRAKCREVRDVIMRLLPHVSKKFPRLTLVQAAERAMADGLPAIKPKTVNGYMSNLSALFRYAIKEAYMDFNPANDLTVASDKNDADVRDPFSDDQLIKIFAAPLYTGCKDDQGGYAKIGDAKPRRGRFWVPLISLFSGMRLNEICQLMATDIEQADDVWAFRVHTERESEKRVKSLAGRRYIPVHPTLVELGLVNHRVNQMEAGEMRMFPELPMGASGYYSDPFQKWFSRFLVKLNAKTDATSFHSFRHNFRDALREADASPERGEVLCGWSDSGRVSEKYGRGFKISTLFKEISKVAYPNLGLQHLIRIHE